MGHLNQFAVCNKLQTALTASYDGIWIDRKLIKSVSQRIEISA